MTEIQYPQLNNNDNSEVPAPTNDNAPAVVAAKNVVHEIAIPHQLLASGVTRSYSDIEWLRQQLILESPSSIVPRVPARQMHQFVTGSVIKGGAIAEKQEDPVDADLVRYVSAWFELISSDATLSQSDTLRAFLTNKPMSTVKADAIAAMKGNNVALPSLTRTDSLRLIVFKMWREMRFGSNGAADSTILDPSIEESVRRHKEVSQHMLANAKLMFAEATRSIQRQSELADVEAKLAQTATKMVATNESASPANDALQNAATGFSQSQISSSQSDRMHALHNQELVVHLQMWLCVCQGYADAVERLALSRDTSHFLAPLLSKVETGKKNNNNNSSNVTPAPPSARAEAISLRLQVEINSATSVGLGLNANAAALQQVRTRLVGERVFQQWQSQQQVEIAQL